MALHFALWCLSAIVACISAQESVFNAENCGPNYYGDVTHRPAIGRLMEFPWLARLGYRKGSDTEFVFQGTLIHPYYVVTTVFAADYNKNSLQLVRLGEYHTGTEEDCQEIEGNERCAPEPQDIMIERIIKHPNRDKPKLANDLVLIKLQRSVDLSTEFVRPICVPTQQNLPLTEDSLLFLSAWCGSKAIGISDVPLQYRMQMIGVATCAQRFASSLTLDFHESQFCAVLDLDKKFKGKTKDISLRGSTGAPLQMLGEDGRFYLVGMTSIGVRNAALDTPYVFVNLVQLAHWLEETVTTEEQNRLYVRSH